MTDIERALSELIKYIRQSNKEQQEQMAAVIRLGIVNLLENGNTQHCQVKTAAGEVLNDVAFLETYGFTTKPVPNSETLVFNVNGNKANNVVLNIGNRELRFKGLKNGEVAMYDNSGNLLHFKNGGTIDFKAGSDINITAQTATINAQSTTINGMVNLAGGGQPVARLGDMVEVDPQTHKGFITSGSSEVTAK